MDIFNIQSLIAKRKLVTTADIDLANSYLQLGVYQPNLRKKGGAENAYPAFAISLEDIIAASQVCNNPLPFKKGSVGEKVSFVKKNYADPYGSRDVIIPGVLEIARGNNQGIYNIAVESSFNSNISPENTEWNSQYVDAANTSWSPLWDLSNRTYNTWFNSLQTPEGNHAPPLQIGMPMVMHEITTNRYWLIMFTEWTSGGNGGGFAYDRYEIFPGVYYERLDGDDAAVDAISPGVHIARKSNGGALYNTVNETESLVGQSPYNTRWNSVYTDSRTGYSGFTDLSNLESRVYTDFTLALDYAVGNNVLSTDLIMHDLTTDLYYKVVFDSWTQGGNGGGFAYTRTVIPQNCSIKFADGTTTTVGGSAGSGGGGYTPSYKVYSALLTQSGVGNPPTAVVLEDTLGAVLNWYYDSTGIYYAESFGTFINNKTAVIGGPTTTTGATILQTYTTSPDQVYIVTAKIDNTPIDDKLDNTFIEIRVYN